MKVTLHVVSETQTDRTDEELAQEAKTHPAVFDTLYERYCQRIYRYLRVRVLTEEDAADLTQQVFLKAFHALTHYQAAKGAFAAWLFRIALHVATDLHRKQKTITQS